MSTEPKLVTPVRLHDVLQELIAREPIFHRPELGTSRRELEDMTELEFWEVGASGRRVTRRATIWRRRAGAWRIVHHQGTVVER